MPTGGPLGFGGRCPGCGGLPGCWPDGGCEGAGLLPIEGKKPPKLPDEPVEGVAGTELNPVCPPCRPKPGAPPNPPALEPKPWLVLLLLNPVGVIPDCWDGLGCWFPAGLPRAPAPIPAPVRSLLKS